MKDLRRLCALNNNTTGTCCKLTSEVTTAVHLMCLSVTHQLTVGLASLLNTVIDDDDRAVLNSWSQSKPPPGVAQ